MVTWVSVYLIQRERLIVNRLIPYTEDADGLFNSKFGLRKGKSILDAIKLVVLTAEVEIEHKRSGIRYCAVVPLNVKNAFNSASWEVMVYARPAQPFWTAGKIAEIILRRGPHF